MLTSDLLQVKTRGELVVPVYVDVEDDELLHLAKSLIDIVETHKDCTRGELQGELKEFLGTGTEFQLHRGLAKLLLDRCEFETASPVEPPEFRQAVFTAAAQAWMQTDTDFDAEKVRQEICEQYEISPENFQQNLYGDLKSEQQLQEFKKPKPEWLLLRYNAALAQAVLFRATKLRVQLKGDEGSKYRAMFRKLKFFQLMYEVTGTAEEGYELLLDGPVSLFKSSQKYGLQMASFLPTLLHFQNFKLTADLLWGKQRQPKQFVLSSETGLKPYNWLTGQWQPEEMEFLLKMFPKRKTDWNISQAAELIDLNGKGVLVPDYVFEHQQTGRKVYLEIFGFWRRGAVTSRLKLLREAGPKNLILAISKELAVDENALEGLPNDVYVFRTTPVATEIAKLLKRWEPDAG